MKKEDILEYLKAHKSEFKENFGVKEIALFGSYARGDYNKRSDIDILVSMPADYFKLFHLKEKIEADLKKRVDIVREHKYLKPLFKELIKRDIIYV